MNNPQWKAFYRGAHVGSHGPRSHVGLLLHVLPRADLTHFVKQAIQTQLPSHLADFQLEVKTLHRKRTKTRAYVVTVESALDSDALSAALCKACPCSTATVHFVPNKVWNSISSKEKGILCASHSQYQVNHKALVFKGIPDSSAILSGLQSIQNYIKGTLSKGGIPLFLDVSESIDGRMALLVQSSHYSEGLQWLSRGGLQVAQQAATASIQGISLTTDVSEVSTTSANSVYYNGVIKAMELQIKSLSAVVTQLSSDIKTLVFRVVQGPHQSTPTNPDTQMEETSSTPGPAPDTTNGPASDTTRPAQDPRHAQDPRTKRALETMPQPTLDTMIKAKEPGKTQSNRPPPPRVQGSPTSHSTATRYNVKNSNLPLGRYFVRLPSSVAPTVGTPSTGGIAAQVIKPATVPTRVPQQGLTACPTSLAITSLTTIPEEKTSSGGTTEPLKCPLTISSTRKRMVTPPSRNGKAALLRARQFAAFRKQALLDIPPPTGS